MPAVSLFWDTNGRRDVMYVKTFYIEKKKKA